MDADEFARWIAIDARDPLPDRRMDWQFAALAALNANLHAKREGGGTWAPAEFRLFAKAWDPPEAPEDQRRAVATAILGAAESWNERRRHER